MPFTVFHRAIRALVKRPLIMLRHDF